MKSKINISIDDISPHPKSSIKVLDRCKELIAVFPDIKFTLFIPMAYTRLNEKSYDVKEYPEFCNVLKELNFNNFELGWHGYYHGILNQSNNDEFQYLNKYDAISILLKMFNVAESVGIRYLFKPILRPSAFRMSPDAIEGARLMGMNILALSPKDHIREIYKGKDIEFNNNYGKVVYYNVNPPFDPLQLFSKTEIVYHACEWDKSYLSEEKTIELKRFLERNLNDIEFSFIGGL